MARQAGRRRPRQITEDYLEKAALHYLGRFASSSGNLRQVLTRRVRKAARETEVDETQAAAWIETLVAKLQRAGVIDDRAYAEGRVVALRRGGDSARAIRMKLAAKGVARDVADGALAIDEPGNDELAAAVAYARRRRLGPFRPAGERRERRERDLAALARKGFAPDLCRRVVDAADEDALEELATAL